MRADSAGPAAPAAGPAGVLLESGALGLAAVAAYGLAVGVLTRVHSVARSDDLLGGMWSAVAAVFVCKTTLRESARAALTRMAATVLSFALTLVYLLAWSFHPWGLALVVAVGALVPTLAGRPGDVTTGAITSIVVMVVAALEPHDAWQQPILRLADTTAGVLVGLAAAWLTTRVAWASRARRRRLAA